MNSTETKPTYDITKVLDIARNCGIEEKFTEKPWDGFELAFYADLPQSSSTLGAAEANKRLAPRGWTLDLGNHSTGVLESEAAQMMARLDEAKIPYNTTPRTDAYLKRTGQS